MSRGPQVEPSAPGHEALLRLEEVSVRFALPGWRRHVQAVDRVSFAMARGDTLALIGESGSGKSTLGRCILGLLRPQGGRVIFDGTDLARLGFGARRRLRPRLQMVFQDPWASLNRRMRIGALVEEPLLFLPGLDAAARRRRVQELLDQVELDPALAERRPPELSGGQLQRVCIARALATRPDLVVLDEPTSSLDLSIRASIVALLARLQAEQGLAMLFISHDLATVRQVSRRVIVLRQGEVVEEGATEAVLRAPQHPYTQLLMAAHLEPTPPPMPRGWDAAG
jgi:ABC-type glutathione transport system ATPase component